MLLNMQIWRRAGNVRRGDQPGQYTDDGAYAEYQRWVAAGRPELPPLPSTTPLGAGRLSSADAKEPLSWRTRVMPTDYSVGTYGGLGSLPVPARSEESDP